MSSPYAFLGQELLNGTEKVSIDTLATAPVVAVYFSAHWCPPCRGFTPVLAEWYNSVNEDGKKVEIVFVSCDQNQQQFENYYGEMPWLSVPFSAAKVQEIKQTIPFNGIPYLVVLKKDGTILSTNGRGDVSAKGPACADEWVAQA